jgi:hypothetical protein
MARATIKFSQPDVEDPVYVVTDMSTPPWEVLKMTDSGVKSESGDAIFVYEFDGVDDGTHQYKIRIGDNDWILDNTKDTCKLFPHFHKQNLCGSYPTEYDTPKRTAPNALQT